MEKSKKFKSGNTSYSLLWHIRKEVLKGNGERKTVRFIVEDPDWVKGRGVGFDERSDRILEKEKSNLGEISVVYWWNGVDFEKRASMPAK